MQDCGSRSGGRNVRMKEKLKEFWRQISFKTLWDEEEEDDWEDFDTRDDYVSGADERKGISLPAFDPIWIWAIVAALAVIAIVAYQVSSRHHLYTSYKKTSEYPAEDITGTSYARLGSDFLKYGSDGVTLVSPSNETIWSSAYTMKSTAFDQAGDCGLIYEQQGTQIVTVGKEGLIGQFKTDLPILKGSVSNNGVCALLLRNGENTLIRLYSPDGTTLAEVKPTLEQTGMPIALDLAEGATRLMVSMVKAGEGTVDSSIVFYDFSSASETADQHITGTVSYTDEVFPEVFFADSRTPVAVAHDRIVVFSGLSDPSEKANVQLGGEIASVCHDENYVGVVRLSSDAANRYELSVYNYRGRQTMDTLFNQGYKYVRFDSGEILLWSQGHMMSYTPQGVKRLDSDFEGRITFFVKTPGFRNYSILSNTGITRIKAE